MPRFWLNLKKEVFEHLDDFWYSLDEGKYLDNLKEEYIYQDPQRGICSRNEDNFYLFYLLNDMSVSAPGYQTTSIDEIPIEELSRLSNFSLEGLFTKARIIKIIDATHLELAFFFSFTFLSTYQVKTTSQGRSLTRFGIPYPEDKGFFLRKKCLLKDIETFINTSVENRSIRNQLALEQLTSLCNSFGNFVYVYFQAEGKSSYHPVILYKNDDQTFSINNYLIHYQHPEYGNLFMKDVLVPPDEYLIEKEVDSDEY